MKPIRKSMRVYIFEGPAPEDLSGIEPDIVFRYHEDGREDSRTEYGVPTYYIYDENKRLVEERTVDEYYRRSKVYEYDPDGELIHIHTEYLGLGYAQGYELMPNGCFDTTRIIERVEMVPTGKTVDEWISWEENGQVRRTEVSEKYEEGDIKKYTMFEKIVDGEVVGYRFINPQGEEELEYHKTMAGEEYTYDENGNWTRCRLLNSDGTISMECVRVFDYEGEIGARENQ